MRKFNSWEYDADVSGIREYTHETFKVYYDRIPFKIDEFISHLFTDSQVFLDPNKLGIKIDNVSDWELKDMVKKELIYNVLELRLVELDNLKIKFEKTKRDLGDGIDIKTFDKNVYFFVLYPYH